MLKLRACTNMPMCTFGKTKTRTWHTRPSTGPRSSVNSFPIVKSMLKFLKVVSVRIFMVPVAGSWVTSLVGFNRQTIFLRAKLTSKRRKRERDVVAWATVCYFSKAGFFLSLTHTAGRGDAQCEGVNGSGVTQRTRWWFHYTNVLQQIKMVLTIKSDT